MNEPVARGSSAFSISSFPIMFSSFPLPASSLKKLSRVVVNFSWAWSASLLASSVSSSDSHSKSSGTLNVYKYVQRGYWVYSSDKTYGWYFYLPWIENLYRKVRFIFFFIWLPKDQNHLTFQEDLLSSSVFGQFYVVKSWTFFSFVDNWPS